MDSILKMNKLEFVEHLIGFKGVDSFYYYYEKTLLSMKFNLDEMKIKFLIYLEDK